jgi:hypothetical protein
MATYTEITARRPARGEPRVTVEKHPLGWIVRVPDEPDGSPGSLRIDRVQALYREGSKAGMKWVEVTAAAMLRAEEADRGVPPAGWAFALLTRSFGDGVRWRDEIEARIPADLDPVQRWIRGRDYGRSAGNLAFALSGKRHPTDAHILQGGDITAVPSDAEEFGRCLSLLRAAPYLLERLPGMVGPDTAWGPIVAMWAALEAAMDAGEPKRVDAALRVLAETRKTGKRVTMEGEGWTAEFPAALFKMALPGLTDEQLVQACAVANLSGKTTIAVR